MKSEAQLFNRNFNLVIIGQMISIFGNSVLRFALPLYILEQTGSTAIFGTILAISTIPTILFSPLGGILADNTNRRNIMVILDMITAIMIGIFSILLMVGPVVIYIGILMCVFSIIQSFYQPVVQASIPVISSKDNLEKANGIVSLVNAVSNLVGPLLAGILYGLFGIWPIMMTGVICFFFASIMEMFIKMTFVKQPKQENVFKKIQADFKTSIHFVTQEKPIMIRVMLIASGMNLFLTSMILVGIPAMIKVKLALSSELYGFTQGAMAAGMITGGILSSFIGKKIKTGDGYLFLVIPSFALIPIGLAFSFPISAMVVYYVILLSCFTMMVSITIFTITMMSFVQRVTPNHLIGKVISYMLVLTQCTLPIGQTLYGLIFEVGMNSINVIVFVTALFSGVISIFSKWIFRFDEGNKIRKMILIKD